MSAVGAAVSHRACIVRPHAGADPGPIARRGGGQEPLESAGLPDVASAPLPSLLSFPVVGFLVLRGRSGAGSEVGESRKRVPLPLKDGAAPPQLSEAREGILSPGGAPLQVPEETETESREAPANDREAVGPATPISRGSSAAAAAESDAAFPARETRLVDSSTRQVGGR